MGALEAPADPGLEGPVSLSFLFFLKKKEKKEARRAPGVSCCFFFIKKKKRPQGLRLQASGGRLKGALSSLYLLFLLKEKGRAEPVAARPTGRGPPSLVR